MKKYTDRHRREVEYQIVERVGRLAYHLHLPPRLPVHPIFHVSLLKPYYADNEDPAWNQPHQPPPTVQAHFSDQAEDILAHRTVNGGGCHHAHRVTSYLVKWVSKPTSEATWEREVDL